MDAQIDALYSRLAVSTSQLALSPLTTVSPVSDLSTTALTHNVAAPNGTTLPQMRFLTQETALKVPSRASADNAAVTKLGTTDQDTPPPLLDGKPAYTSGTDTSDGASAASSGKLGHSVVMRDFVGSYDEWGAPTISTDDGSGGGWYGSPVNVAPNVDSGMRADFVEAYWLLNADKFGTDILSRSLTDGEKHTFRDWIHGEIKQHHRGSAQVITDVLHQLATSQEAHDRRNDIYQQVLDRDIDDSGNKTAVDRMSVANYSLTQLRHDVAYSPEGQSDDSRVWSTVHGQNPQDSDIQYAEQKIADRTSLQQYRWDEAHNDRADSDIKRFYHDILNRDADTGGLQTFKDDLGRKASYQSIRAAIADSGEATDQVDRIFQEVDGGAPSSDELQRYKGSLETGGSLAQIRNWEAYGPRAEGLIKDAYQYMLGREASESDLGHYKAWLNGSANQADVRYDLAHGHEAYDSIANHVINIKGSALSGDESNLVHKLQDDLGNKLINMNRIHTLLDYGAKVASIVKNEDPGNYTPVPGAPPTAYLYTTGSGRQILLDNRSPPSAVAADGKMHSDVHAYNLKEIGSAIGHGGRFDIQRDKSQHIAFNDPKIVDGANYNVGVWMAAAGFNWVETEVLGGIYILCQQPSERGIDTFIRDRPLWAEGWNDYTNGKIR